MHPMKALYVAACSAVAIVVLAVAAVLTHQPLIFPSLGPTAFVVFFVPLAAQASPRNVISAHFIGVLSGVVALLVFGLWSTPADLEDITWSRAGAVTLCVFLTFAIKIGLDVPHAPAGATTLIVGLGLLRTPEELVILMVAIVAMTAMGFALNRLAGIDVPVWRPRATAPSSPPAPGEIHPEA